MGAGHEDCGGIPGYYTMLELKHNPPHPTSRADAERREMLEWLGDWDPERVDLAEINRNLGRVRVKKTFKTNPKRTSQ